ncbi:MAG: ABC-F family ATP-binding cassette domain-containing protein [Oscillospiraceae bacterium]|nr:ABC-F family ATP-binding cassette domain-containing protein [Oscillospiraceae bacterium]
MILLTAQDITKSYMERPVLDHVSFFLGEGDKVGIIGINGTGKSTLLRILAGAEEPDSGQMIRTNGIRVSYLPQIPAFENSGTVLSQVLAHLPEDLADSREFEARATLARLGIPDYERDIASLSGGERRRAGIAAALIAPSDVLLLDEPTNHIDHETAQMLEDLLLRYRGAIVMVTHDRYFLDKICNRIVEVDRGQLYPCDGNYSAYVTQKAQREADAQAAERKARSLYRQELAWISRGARARGTKSKDRIERFEALRDREIPAEAERLQLQSVSSRLGKKTIEIEQISKQIDGKQLISDFSYILPRNARIGIIGRNGAGKSTFLRMLAGEILPDSGSITAGDTVKIGYFSQECENMDPKMRVIDYIRETAEIVHTPEGNVTAAQMLERFLFNGELQWNSIEKLSGGERKRLYLLKILMTAPNVLLLDEPTNDLDILTLTILEDYLRNFDGAVLAVSHDRYFLDKIASELFVFRDGVCIRHHGNYSDNLESLTAGMQPAQKPAKVKKERVRSAPAKLKFTFREQFEFEHIDEEIAALEAQIAENDQAIQDAGSDYVRLQALTDQHTALQAMLEEKMERWVYLNDLAERIQQEEAQRP